MDNSSTNPFVNAKRFEEQGEFGLAAEQYQKAISLGIGDPSLAHQGRGRALARLGHLEEAVEECQMALGLNPDLSLAHGVLGYVYLLQAKYGLAEKELLFAPHDEITLAHLALVYSELGRYREATERREELLQLQPDNMETRIRLAGLYMTQSYYQKALRQLNRIIITEPTRLTIYPWYPIALGRITLSYLGQLNILSRIGMAALVFLMAVLAPTFVSIPLGIVFSILSLLVATALVHGLIHIDKSERKRIFLVLFAFVCSLLLYWLLVSSHP
jgi:tetratricopeptide (TPR) repeat protein